MPPKRIATIAKKRKLTQKLFVSICFCSALLTASLLVVILGVIFSKGLPVINLDYIIKTEFEAEGFNRGIANTIVGTILLAVTSVVLATPLAIALALYLSEYSKENRYAQTLRFLLDLLAGIPSIVLGGIGFILFVFMAKFITGGFSLLSGAIAVGILILPTITRSAEEAIKVVPRELKEASYAVGATKWQTTMRIILPCSLSGIITGVVLGIGRAAEESSIVVLTAGYTQYMPEFAIKHVGGKGYFMDTIVAPFQEKVGTLPISVYHSYEFSKMVPMEYGFAAATVLILIVMSINLIAKWIAHKYHLRSS